MKKKTIRVNLPYQLYWGYGVSIEQIREDLDEIEKLGATEINIEPYESYGSAGVDIEAVVERLETDEEFEIRKNKEKNHLDRVLESELKRYEELKLKFEK